MLTIGKFNIYITIKFWRLGSYEIGASKMHQFGPIRILVIGE